jgi:hypothetical protein
VAVLHEPDSLAVIFPLADNVAVVLTKNVLAVERMQGVAIVSSVAALAVAVLEAMSFFFEVFDFFPGPGMVSVYCTVLQWVVDGLRWMVCSYGLRLWRQSE